MTRLHAGACTLLLPAACANPEPPGGELPVNGPAPLVPHAVQLDGVELHYVEQGAGPPVVLVHGSLADYTYWEWSDGSGPSRSPSSPANTG